MAKLRTSLPRSRLEKLRSQEQSQPVVSCDYIDNFTKGLEVRRDLGNRAHVKTSSQYFEQSPGHFASSWERRRKWGSGLNHVKLLKPPVAQISGLVNYFFFRQTGFCDYCACFNRFPIPKQDFSKTLSLGVGNLLKHFTTVFTLFTCQSTVCICQRSEKLKWYQPRVGKSLFS